MSTTTPPVHTLEYSGGFCERVTGVTDTVVKIREACIEDPETLSVGGILTTPDYSTIRFYELNWRGDKAFVASIVTKDLDFINAVVANI